MPFCLAPGAGPHPPRPGEGIKSTHYLLAKGNVPRPLKLLCSGSRLLCERLCSAELRLPTTKLRDNRLDHNDISLQHTTCLDVKGSAARRGRWLADLGWERATQVLLGPGGRAEERWPRGEGCTGSRAGRDALEEAALQPGAAAGSDWLRGSSW